MQIPLVDLRREYSFLGSKIKQGIERCFLNQEWILSSLVKEFEEKLKNFLKVRYALGVSSGTSGLVIALRALSFSYRKRDFFSFDDEIITTPLTFIATAEAILRVGAKPVFVDISPDTFNIDPEAVKKAITKKTLGILPVHLYGLGADIKTILRIARQNNLFVLEDAAQSFGASFKNKFLGTFADAGVFSFFPSKNLGAYGDAGAIVSPSRKIMEIARALRNHGQRRKNYASYLGYNSRLDALQAAVLLAKLSYVLKMNKKRKQIAAYFNQAFSKIKGIKTPFIPSSYEHIFHLYTLRVPEEIRDIFLKFLNRAGIAARVYYPYLLPEMKVFKTRSVVKNIKNAQRIKREIISLPLHPFLEEKEINYIIKKVNYFFHKYVGK